MKLHGTMTVNNDELYIGGVSCLELSKKYQTPLYVFDEALVRQNCREYIEYFKAREGKNKDCLCRESFFTSLHV